jgi:hypothetical protein
LATISEAIKRLTWIFTSTGADKVAADNNKVADSQTKIAVSASTTEKASLSLEKSFDALERRFNSTIRAQQDYEKVQARVNAAVAQNPALQERANDVLAKAQEYFDKGKGSVGAWGTAVDTARGAALGLSAGLGPVGAVLGSFGPLGLVAAAGIGLVVNALAYMNEQAAKAGESSSRLKQFADVTGLTIGQVRGVTEAGGELGVASDVVTGSLEKFTLQLDEARKGGGALFDQIQAIDAQLAIDLASTRSGAEAIDLLTKAYNSTTDATTRAAIAKAAFGKGGAAAGPVLGVIGDAGGVDAYSASIQKALGITDEWTKRVAALSNENKSLEESLAAIKSSVYSEEILERQNRFLKNQVEIAKYVRDVANAAKEYVSKGGSGPTTDEFGAPFDFTLLNQNKAAAATSTSGGGAPAAANDNDAKAAAIEAETKATQDLTAARLDAAKAEELAASQSINTVTMLGGAATGAEIAEARFHKLTAAFLENKFGASDSAEALDKYQRALHGDTGNQSAALHDQLAVIQAVGGAAKIAAQNIADYNSFLRAGKEPADALQLAADKMANSQAAAIATAQQATKSLEDQNELAKAQTLEQKKQIDQAQTYKKVLEDTKSEVTARQAEEAVSVKYNIQIADAAERTAANLRQARVAADQMAQSLDKASIASAEAFESQQRAATQAQGGVFGGDTPGLRGQNQGGSSGAVSTSNAGAALLNASNWEQTTSQLANSIISSGRGIDAAIRGAQNNSSQMIPNPYVKSKITESDTLSTVQALYDLKNAQTNDNNTKVANLNEELAWLNSRPETIARDQAIANLMSSIDSLKQATNANTAATAATLNPLYSQGHGALAIGYYHAATGLDVMAQGPSSGDTIPFHAMVNGGERIQITPAGQSSNDNSKPSAAPVQNIYMDLRGMNTNTARRSRRQIAQGLGQTAAAGR